MINYFTTSLHSKELFAAMLEMQCVYNLLEWNIIINRLRGSAETEGRRKGEKESAAKESAAQESAAQLQMGRKTKWLKARS